jgi:adenylate cyclase
MLSPALRAAAEARSSSDELVNELLVTLSDLELLHDSVTEHSSELENELERKNAHIEAMIANMRRYLSRSLFERIAGGGSTQAGATTRRNLTVFFSDIVGFTSLTDTVEPETLSQVLNTYLGKMSDICERHGGTIDKFIGDAVMIFFGDSDDADPNESAKACVRMAVEMQAEIVALRPEWAQFGTQLGLQVRMGINSGYCTVGNFGSGERIAYTIIGGNVNVASRLEHQAEPGGICISGSTYALVKDMVDVQAMGALQVKGVAHAIESYQLLGLLPEQAQSNPWLSIDADGFRLRLMDYDAQSLSALQKQRMREALELALRKMDA